MDWSRELIITDWITASSKKRTAYIELQLEYLESSLPDTRRAAQGRLLYLLQGALHCQSSATRWSRS
jgi:hypothetical protein